MLSPRGTTYKSKNESRADLYPALSFFILIAFDDAALDENGLTVGHFPLALGTVENIRKALQYLWKHQARTDIPHPNPATNPRRYIPLNEAIETYGVALVYGKVSTGTTTRTATCLTRNPYTEKLFLRMLSYTWRMLPLRQTCGKRTYNRRRRFQFMRERFCLLARHHMLLRDEDLRSLNLANAFNVQTMHPAPGSKLASGIVFCLSRGKSNHKGTAIES